MNGKNWGFHINHFGFSNNNTPDPPTWLKPPRLADWHREGLVIWNANEQRIGVVTGNDALILIEKLYSRDVNTREDIVITHWVTRTSFPLRRRGKSVSEDDQEEFVSETVEEELVRLPPESADELINFLRENQLAISEIADHEKHRFSEVIKLLLQRALESKFTSESKDFDFSSRKYPWKNLDKHRWACHHNSAIGKVCLDLALRCWYVQVDVSRGNGRTRYFHTLAEAVEWVESELEVLTKETNSDRVSKYIHSEKQRRSNRIRIEEKQKFSSFWIEPAQMVPPNPSYQAFVEIDANPLSFKTSRTPCGEERRFDKRYLSPSKIAASLGLDFDTIKIDQPLGDNSGWFLIAFITSFFQKSIAITQAQRFWEHSKIIQEYKRGSIRRARFGYREAETDYAYILGAIDDPENPWEPISSYEDHLAVAALRETLCYALDVDDYRDFIGLTAEAISDERLLKEMHKIRAVSKHVPIEARQESEIWLVVNA